MKEFQWRREQLKNSVIRLKKKWELYQRAATEFHSSLEDLEKRVDFLDSVSVSLADGVSRIANRENKELRRENEELRRIVNLREEINHEGIAIGSTWCVFSTMLDYISGFNPDVRVALESVIFPSVFMPIMSGHSEYLVDEFPSQSEILVYEGAGLVKMVQEEAKFSLTTPEVWDKEVPVLQSWVKDNLLPRVIGDHVESCDPLPLEDMLLWRESPGDRDQFFPDLFDMYELYRKNKETIFRELDVPSVDRKLREFLENG